MGLSPDLGADSCAAAVYPWPCRSIDGVKPSLFRYRATALAFAFALVLKAFVPLLASASAAMQGVGVGEICSVYGVTLPMLGAPASTTADHLGHGAHAGHLGHDGGGDHEPASQPAHGRTTGGDHCALTALVTFASGGDPTASPAWTKTASFFARADADTPRVGRDAAACWAVLIAHAPPPHRSVLIRRSRA